MKNYQFTLKQLISAIAIASSISSIATLSIHNMVIKQSVKVGPVGDNNNFPIINHSGSGPISIQNDNRFSDYEAARRKGKPNISKEQYNMIVEGMSYREAIKIIGSDGKESASTGSIISYTWGNDYYIYLSLTFDNDRLTLKSQNGLW